MTYHFSIYVFQFWIYLYAESVTNAWQFAIPWRIWTVSTRHFSCGSDSCTETQIVMLSVPDSKYCADPEIGGSAATGAEYFESLESHRAIKVKGKSVLFGLGIAFFTGLCCAAFSPLFNLATNDQFHLLKPDVPHLVVYTTFFYFSTAFLICSVLVNVYFLYHPVLGIPKSSLSMYCQDREGRHIAVIAGLLCGIGNGFQFMGGQAAGYAAADAVQVHVLFLCTYFTITWLVEGRTETGAIVTPWTDVHKLISLDILATQLSVLRCWHVETLIRRLQD